MTFAGQGLGLGLVIVRYSGSMINSLSQLHFLRQLNEFVQLPNFSFFFEGEEGTIYLRTQMTNL